MRKNTSAVVATVVIAILALAVAFIAIYEVSKQKQTSNEIAHEIHSVYKPSDELADEMADAVEKLIVNNHSVIRLFYTKGLEHLDEPYGNLPEDGIYTVSDGTYTSVEQVEAVLDETYMPAEAERIRTDPNGKGPVYMTQEDGSFGISDKFVPDDYNLSWNDPSFRLTPISDNECDIEIQVHDTDGNEAVLNGSMLKANGIWLLEKLIYR